MRLNLGARAARADTGDVGQGRVAACGPLQLEKVHRRTRGEDRHRLERERTERGTWSLREPFHGKVRDHRHLPSHEQLPKMGCGSFVGFPHRTAPKIAMWPSTTASAATDIPIGSRALGCLIRERFIRTCSIHFAS